MLSQPFRYELIIQKILGKIHEQIYIVLRLSNVLFNYSPLVGLAFRTRLIKFSLFLSLGIGYFLGLGSSLGVWLLTFPAFVIEPCEGNYTTTRKYLSLFDLNINSQHSPFSMIDS